LEPNLDDLQRLKPKIANVPSAPDPRTEVELLAQELNQKRFELRHKELELTNFDQDIKLRKRFAVALFCVLLFWIFVIIYIVLCSGAGRMVFAGTKFYLSDTVIITLITSTTANIVGFFLVVTNYLFRDKKELQKPAA